MGIFSGIVMAAIGSLLEPKSNYKPYDEVVKEAREKNQKNMWGLTPEEQDNLIKECNERKANMRIY